MASTTTGSSCPVSLGIAPFAPADLGRFEVRFIDGGIGDLDAESDGFCEVGVRVCLGDIAEVTCPAEPMNGLRAAVQGSIASETRRALGRQLAEAIQDLPGSSPFGRSVVFAADATPKGCIKTRLRIPADDGGEKKTVVRVQARMDQAAANPHTRRSWMTIHCATKPADPTAALDPLCFTRTGDCPPMAVGTPTTTPASTTTTTSRPGVPGTTAPTTSTTRVTTTIDTSTTSIPVTTTTSLPPPPPTTLPPSGPSFWISPSGSDSNPGTQAAPWKTFGRAIKALSPGDTLILADGTYTRGTTGLPVVNCANGARNGTANAPITIRAANERRAWLNSDGLYDAFYLNQCAYWNVVGIRASSADNSSANPWDGNVVHVLKSNHITLRRILASRPNMKCPNASLGYCNSHTIGIEDSHDVLVEESEAYEFHRHGISVFRSHAVTVRRCYVNARGNPGAGGGPTGVIFYGASDSTLENVVSEETGGLNVAGSPNDMGQPGGYRNKYLGTITLNNRYGATVRARRFGGPVLPAGDNTMKDCVFANSQYNGVYTRGAANTMLDHVTVIGSHSSPAIAADEDLGEGAPCSANPDGCSIFAQNVATITNSDAAYMIAGVVKSWFIDTSVSSGNHGNWPTSEDPSDGVGRIRDSSSTSMGRGLASGQCLLWPGAHDAYPARGATVLYRYQDGVLTNRPLWDPQTGAFPCGAVVPGVNDAGQHSCVNVHQRLNVNTNGCAFPADYK